MWLSVLCVAALSCDAKETIEDATNKLVKSIDDTRASVETESADWQTTAKNALSDAITGLGSSTSDITSVMQQLITKLPEQVNSTIRVEVTNLMQRAVAAAGAEAKCTTDFLRVRVIEGLRHIQDKLMGIQSPPPPPYICTVVPLAVDLSAPAASRNHIELYGFNMDQAPVRATLERAGGDVDITSRIDRPSHYHLTVNLSGAPAILDKTSRRIRISTEGDTPHTIAVLQPDAKVCETQTVKTQAQTVSVRPDRQGNGGRDFHIGDDSKTRFFGPHVDVNTVLSSNADQIKATVHVGAEVDKVSRETLTNVLKQQQSTIFNLFPQLAEPYKQVLSARAGGAATFDVYKAPIGWKITRINLAARNASFSYDDNDFEQDSFDQGAGGIVGRYVIDGAVKGQPDAGSGTKVDVRLNPIEVEIRKDEDCVDPKSLVLSKAFLSTAVISKFKLQTATVATLSANAKNTGGGK